MWRTALKLLDRVCVLFNRGDCLQVSDCSLLNNLPGHILIKLNQVAVQDLGQPGNYQNREFPAWAGEIHKIVNLLLTAFI